MSEYLNRAIACGQYLVRHQHPDGSFVYRTRPLGGREVPGEYNLLRHCGATWALFRLAEALGRDHPDTPTLTEAANHGCAYIIRQAIPVPGEAVYLVEAGKAKLGALGLALLALTAQSRHAPRMAERVLAFAQRLANGILSLQRPNGTFANYGRVGQKPPKQRTSIYYPGEALLGLVTYATLPSMPSVYLNAAIRGADALILVQQGLPILPHDAWFAQALEQLWILGGELGLDDAQRDRYATHTLAQGDQQLAEQYTEGPPIMRGAFIPLPATSCNTAARGEGVLAAYRLAVLTGDTDRATRSRASLRMSAQVLALYQYPEAPDGTPGYARPSVGGGVAMTSENPSVRIDTVQHALAFWLGLHALGLEDL